MAAEKEARAGASRREAAFDEKLRKKIKQRRQHNQTAWRAASSLVEPKYLTWRPGEKNKAMERARERLMQAKPDLSRAAIKVGVLLTDHYHSEGHGCWMLRDEIARRTGLSLSAVRDALRELAERGFIIRQDEMRDASNPALGPIPGLKAKLFAVAYPAFVPRAAHPDPGQTGCPTPHDDAVTPRADRVPDPRADRVPNSIPESIPEESLQTDRGVAGTHPCMDKDSPSLSPSPVSSLPEQAFSREAPPWGTEPGDPAVTASREQRMARLRDELDAAGGRDPETAARVFTELAKLGDEERQEQIALAEYWQRRLLGDSNKQEI